MASVERQRKRAVNVPLQQSAEATSVLSMRIPSEPRNSGRKGGTKNRRVYEANGWEGSAPRNACDVKNLLAEALAEIRAGRMDPFSARLQPIRQ
jgi:hypothetical protein